MTRYAFLLPAKLVNGLGGVAFCFCCKANISASFAFARFGILSFEFCIHTINIGTNENIVKNENILFINFAFLTNLLSGFLNISTIAFTSSLDLFCVNASITSAELAFFKFFDDNLITAEAFSCNSLPFLVMNFLTLPPSFSKKKKNPTI